MVGVPLVTGSSQVLVGSGQRGLANTQDRNALRGQPGARIDFVDPGS